MALFQYGRAFFVEQLRQAYTTVAEMMSFPSGIFAPLKLSDGSSQEYGGADFPSNALVESWFGIPERFRAYGRNMADWVVNNGQPFDKDVIGSVAVTPSGFGPDIIDDSDFDWSFLGAWFGDKTYSEEGAQAVSPISTHVSGVYDVTGMDPLDTPEWHGRQEDNFYPQSGYTELLDELAAISGMVQAPDTSPSVFTMENTRYDSLVQYQLTRNPSPHTLISASTVGSIFLIYELVNTTNQTQLYNVSISASQAGSDYLPQSNVVIRHNAAFPLGGNLVNDIGPAYAVASGVLDSTYNTSISMRPGEHRRGGIAVFTGMYWDTESSFADLDISVETLDSLGRTDISYSRPSPGAFPFPP